jgi:hypothetical protein
MVVNSIEEWISPFTSISDFFIALQVVKKINIQNELAYKLIHSVISKLLNKTFLHDVIKEFVDTIRLAPQLYPLGM